MDYYKAARKAVNTRKRRQQFKAKYGTEVYNIIGYLRKGYTSRQIAIATDTTTGHVAAIAANLTRGTYKQALRGCKL